MLQTQIGHNDAGLAMKYETHQLAPSKTGHGMPSRLPSLAAGSGLVGVHPVVRMQRALGNHAVQRMIQAHPDVSSPGGTQKPEEETSGHTLRTMPASTIALLPAMAPAKQDEY